MKNISVYCFCFIVFFSCKENKTLEDSNIVKEQINISIDEWHKAAANANFENYFDLMTNDAVFIGTDATENWQNQEFKSFSKPYFDKGKAWGFTSLQRNIYIYDNQNLAWFDELLDTQMELCRGSGIVEKIDNKWKIKHYVLSIAIPNDNVNTVIDLKKKTDSIIKSKLIN